MRRRQFLKYDPETHPYKDWEIEKAYDQIIGPLQPPKEIS